MEYIYTTPVAIIMKRKCHDEPEKPPGGICGLYRKAQAGLQRKITSISYEGLSVYAERRIFDGR
jgi:hypothetical protein